MKVNETNKLNFENEVYNTVHLSPDEKEKPGDGDGTVTAGGNEEGDIKPGDGDGTVTAGGNEEGDIKPHQ